MIHTIDGIIQAAKENKTGIVAVAAAHNDVVIEAVVNARRERIAEPILIGHIEPMRKMLMDLGEDPDSYRMIAAEEDTESAAIAVSLCAEGEADFLMKGILSTADLMRAIFKRDSGLRTGRLASHCMIYQIPAYHKLLMVTDAGVNTFPDLAKKADILENGAMALKAFGYEKIYASCICAAETVNPKVQSTLDAVELRNMTERWAPYNMTVIGPVALDLAVSKEACHHKRFEAAGAGEADLLLVPNYEVGNGLCKATSLFGGSRSAGFLMGARVPVVVVSRSDNADSKMASIAAGSVLAANLKWD